MARPRTGNKRQNLVDAAISLFADKGFYYTTTAEVSAQAGVAAGTLYLYFNSKDDLLVASLERFLDGVEKDVLMPALEETAVERVDTFAKSYIRFIQRNRELARVFLVELRQGNCRLGRAGADICERYFGIGEKLLTDLDSSRETMCDPSTVAPAVLGILETGTMRWLLGYGGVAPVRYTDTACCLLRRLIGIKETVIDG
jgi:AcrR family transcriptional regulator